MWVRMRVWEICSLSFLFFRFCDLLRLANFAVAVVKRLLELLLLLNSCWELGCVFSGLSAFELCVEEVSWESVNGVHFGRVVNKSDKPPTL